ncbi:zinc ribbon domain-containing protein [Haloprofundus sp. MHR1]|uniref:zinc ribbon domain-containing protein n=1 Tax=Haloprofundus sp. MHR1 TaxID=2572921 RepID=UPI0010BF13CD|nr:zinc ribbon domain-containing protein [Haloprofundus sp. MHR1]QCJ47743.1 nucleic acid-binding protein [Haloprofundus sp. MHR1]
MVSDHSPSSAQTHNGCEKCGHDEATTDSISTTGSGFSKFFDVQNRQFTVVSCTNCGYSELYKGQSSGDVVDVFLG